MKTNGQKIPFTLDTALSDHFRRRRFHMGNEQSGACCWEERSSEVAIARDMIDKDRQCVRAWEDRLAEILRVSTKDLFRNPDYKQLISTEGRAILRDLWYCCSAGAGITQTDLAKERLKTLRGRASETRYRKVERVIAAARKCGLVEDIPTAPGETKTGNNKLVRATQALDVLVRSVLRLEQHLMRHIVGGAAEPAAVAPTLQPMPEQRECKS